jgi:small neutral amino acid transporter SnatA (MarC family)
MEKYVQYLFVANALLVIIDAAMGYFLAPLLLSRMNSDNVDSAAWTAGSIRRLLSFVVALYMFFNCMAYFRHNNILLLIVTGVVVFDIAFQLIARWKINRQA